MSQTHGAPHEWEQDEAGYTSSEEEDSRNVKPTAVSPGKVKPFLQRPVHGAQSPGDSTYAATSVIHTLQYAPGQCT